MIVQALVLLTREPPFEWDDQAEDLDQVERGNEDVFVGGAHEAKGLLGEESHVFVDGIVGDIFISRVIEGDENIEENCGRSVGSSSYFWF